MVGAYQREFCSERALRLKSLVDTCNNGLDTCRQEGVLLLWDFHSQLEPAAGNREALKLLLEEFAWAGGILLLSRLLSTLDQALVHAVLSEYQTLLALSFDPFDDDIGEIPALCWLLSERHRSYVDINWIETSLDTMKHFLIGMITVVESPLDDCKPTVFSIVAQVLTWFPAHRVVCSTADLFSVEFCRRWLYELGRAVGTCEATILVQLVEGFVVFGSGAVASRALPQATLCMAVFSATSPSGFRCPCGQCEYHRKVVKQAKRKDDFGAPKAAAHKRHFISNWLEADVCAFLASLMGVTDELPEGFFESLERLTAHLAVVDAGTTTDKLLKVTVELSHRYKTWDVRGICLVRMCCMLMLCSGHPVDDSNRQFFENTLLSVSQFITSGAGRLGCIWCPSMAHLMVPLASLLTIVGISAMPTEAFDAIIEGVRAAIDGSEVHGIDGIPSKIFFGCLVASMAVLTGCKFDLAPGRALLLPPPPLAVGFMASAGRKMIDDGRRNLSKPDKWLGGGGCSFVRVVAGVVIGRAEKASALVAQ